MTHGSLFCGIGGFDLACERLGITTLWQVEQSRSCRRILRKNFPDSIRFREIGGVGAHCLQPVTIVTGGFPCQPYADGGARRGDKDPRALWPEMLRIISELHPRWIIGENVRGLLSLESGRHFEQVCSDLEAEGYEVWPFLLPACAFGAPHRRYRIFVVGHVPHAAGGESGGDKGTGGGTAAAEGQEAEPKGLNAKPSGGEWWEIEPAVGRVADGISHRLDRLKCLGNAVVPQVAFWLLERVVEYERTGYVTLGRR
ncbi:MAG: DNA (cytosine-5-)-methyltransferase [Candidatus Acidiferrales bacterium]